MNIELALTAIHENWAMVDLLSREDSNDLPKKRAEYFESVEAKEPNDWCKQNCTGLWVMFGKRYYFENPKDATMFSLRYA